MNKCIVCGKFCKGAICNPDCAKKGIEKLKMNCHRCRKIISLQYCYTTIDNHNICAKCAIVGEELLPDEDGDLQVSEHGRSALIRLENRYAN